MRNSVDFGRLKSLIRLELEGNKIKNMKFLGGHGKLKYINLNANSIDEIPELYGLVSLIELNIK